MYTESDVSFCHDVRHIKMGQRKLMSCWYSSYRMLYSWHLYQKDSDVKERIEDSSLDFDELMKKGLHPTEFETAKTALCLSGQHGSTIRKLSASDFQQFIRDTGPIWSATDYEGFNHIVLVAGYFKKTGDLIVHNPHNPYAAGDSEPDANLERRPYSWYREKLAHIPFAMQYF
ncbi:MAG: papain-like cysteine protease family protein [Pirellulaceae bacterium]